MAGSTKRGDGDVYDVPVGAPARGILEYIKRFDPASPADRFGVELPGEVVRVDGQYVLGIIPMVKINVGGRAESTKRYAVASLAERDFAATQKVWKSFSRQLLKGRPQTFSVVAESPELTFADVAEALSRKRYRRSAPASVQMRLVASLDGGRMESGAFPGEMVIAGDTETPAGEGDHHFVFDCHAHWHSVLGFNRYTYCHDTGPCPSPLSCLTSTRKSVEKGFCFCACR